MISFKSMRQRSPVAPVAVDHASRWTLDAAIAELKVAVTTLDRAVLCNGGEVPADLASELQDRFAAFCLLLNEHLGDSSLRGEEAREGLGAHIQRELLPYILLTENCERWYAKPRGYAGDFLTIEWIYRNRAGGTGRIGPVLDRCFLDLPAAAAVRNRRGLLREEIEKTIAARQSATARVLSLASGPARELFDVYETLEDPAILAATCVDIDLQALAFVADLRDARKLKRTMHLQNVNLAHVATGRAKLELPPQDLAYSIGLIDYFEDPFVVQLLDAIHDRLRPGGRVILGNFHPDNPTRAVMDHLLDWKLIHRTEDDLNRLFQVSKFGRPCDEIRFEAERVNLFAIGSRAPA
jgi:extracellular factor (EF) 3-hydroxypalmitic acid methyl ester biosynthesis protein